MATAFRPIAIATLCLLVVGCETAGPGLHDHQLTGPWASRMPESTSDRQSIDEPIAGQNVISLEEAQQLAFDVSQFEYRPPPRTIRDIQEIIGQPPPKPDYCFEIQTDRRLEFEFFADRIGVRGFGTHPETRVSRFGGEAEEQLASGNFKRALELIREAAEKPGVNLRLKAVLYTRRARVQAETGDLKAAIRSMSAASDLWNKIRPFSDPMGFEKLSFELHDSAAQGSIAFREGDLLKAVVNFENAIQAAEEDPYFVEGSSSFRSEGAYFDRALLFAQLSAALLQQGRISEAELAVRTGIRKAFDPRYFFPNKYGARVARLLTQLAAVLLEQGRMEEAMWAARMAVRFHQIDCSLPNSLGFVLARKMLIQVLSARQDWEGVLAGIEAAREELGNQPEEFERLFGANVDWAMALVQSGRTFDGLSKIETALKQAIEDDGEVSYRVAEIRGLRVALLVAAKNLDAAKQEFESAVPKLIEQYGKVTGYSGEVFRGSRAQYVLTAYLTYLDAIQTSNRNPDLDPIDEAFWVANALQSGSVERAVTEAAIRLTPRDPDLARVLESERRAKHELGTVIDTLSSLTAAAPGQVEAEQIASLRKRANGLQAAQIRLSQELDQRFPEFAELLRPKPLRIDEARSLLADDESLILIYSAKRRTYVWAFQASGPIRFASGQLGRSDLHERVVHVRRALSGKIRVLGDIEPFDIAATHALFEALLSPVRQGWEGASNLLVVASSPMDQLPISLLPTDGAPEVPDQEILFAGYRQIPWVAKSHAVTNLPSVSSLARLRHLPAGQSSRRPFAGFGDPWFSEEQASLATNQVLPNDDALSDQQVTARGLQLRLRSFPEMRGLDSAQLGKLPRLPDTAEEVRSIARVMKADLSRDVFVGKEANELNVKTQKLSSYRVLAFATHGLVPGGLDGLTQPSLALTAPQVANIEGDGLLSMSEVLDLTLDADWVVLSACNTAAADGAGAEAVSGLGRAFFFAGARSLLVSNWPVETTSAKVLTTDIFLRQAADPSLSRAEALRRAMVALIEGPGFENTEGGTLFSYAHPIFWAPFTIVGDGGNSRDAGS